MKTITLTPDASGMVDWPTLSNDKKSVVTIGSFDGMHQGHQAVIRRVVELAKKEQSFSVVVLFDPRPALVHGYAAQNGGQEPPAGMIDTQALTSMQERLRAINKLGVDYTLIVRYTLAFAAKSYRFFLGQMVGKLGMRALVLGSDAAMGANRAGDVKAIENLALATGVFQLDVVDDRGPGETACQPMRSRLCPPTMVSRLIRWKVRPRRNVAHGARKTRRRPCACGAPRMCVTCWAMGASKTPTRFWDIRMPWKAPWCMARNVDAPSASPRRI